jgi:hypothetical protein
MNSQIFLQVITQFNQGSIQFNLGEKWSFLFNNHWYPTRAFMKNYFQQLGQPTDCNLHNAVFEISKFIPVISANVMYNNHLPIRNL